ncbi:MAG TPA: RsmB/NOP family class I SAM-dependent RNA methyltransferase [Opitutaceae bacterium]
MSSPVPPGTPATAWPTAARLLVRWLDLNERVDALLEGLPRTWPRAERARCQALLFGAVRNLGRIESHLTTLLARPPRARVRAVLLLAGYELIEGGGDGHTARVVHHAVEQAKALASPAEARLVNAVVRKLATALAAEAEPGPQASTKALAAYFSHPQWLVDRWWAQFGPEATRALLAWNQRPAPLYARWRLRERGPTDAELAWLVPTPWAGFYEIKPGHWADAEPLLASGVLYVQDPATRLAVELLAPQAGEAVLDACAAPGGKSVAIADAMGRGRVVAIDLPGPRIERLKSNLALAPSGVDVALVPADLAKNARKLLEEFSLPLEYPAVLIDVPCSNTGVMRHRVDVKWRLQEGDFHKHAQQQLALLSGAARYVAPGGRLVYSTCSLDADENERVVEAFRRKSAGRFDLVDQRMSRPWETGHDGAAVFLLRRTE